MILPSPTPLIYILCSGSDCRSVTVVTQHKDPVLHARIKKNKKKNMPTTITMRSDGTQGWDEEVRQRKNWRNREKKVGEEEQNEPEG